MEKETCEKAILETTKKASQAALKWFNETFDDGLLEEMEEKGLIAQAEGFNTSAAAELMATIEMEILGKLVEEEVDAQHDGKEEGTGPSKVEHSQFSGEIKDMSMVRVEQYVYKVSCKYRLKWGGYWIPFEGEVSAGSPIKSTEALTKALRLALVNTSNGDL